MGVVPGKVLMKHDETNAIAVHFRIIFKGYGPTVSNCSAHDL